jgi:hypothetical protein
MHCLRGSSSNNGKGISNCKRYMFAVTNSLPAKTLSRSKGFDNDT